MPVPSVLAKSLSHIDSVALAFVEAGKWNHEKWRHTWRSACRFAPNHLDFDKFKHPGYYLVTLAMNLESDFLDSYTTEINKK